MDYHIFIYLYKKCLPAPSTPHTAYLRHDATILARNILGDDLKYRWFNVFAPVLSSCKCQVKSTRDDDILHLLRLHPLPGGSLPPNFVES